MAWLKKIENSPFWYLEWRGEQNKICRRSTKLKDRREAEKILRQHEHALVMKKFGVEMTLEAPTMIEAAAQYLKQKEDMVRAKTLKMDAWAIEGFLGWMDDSATVMRPADLTVEILSAYRKERKSLNRRTPGKAVSESTVAIELRHLKVFLSWLHERGWMKPLPLKISAVKREADRVMYLTLQDVDLLLAATEKYRYHFTSGSLLESGRQMRELLEFLLLTGARVGETLALTWGMIDWERRKIHLRGQTTKSGKRREIEISESLLVMLTAMKDRRQRQESAKRIWVWNTDWPNKRFKQLAKSAGLDPKLSIHCLRHTCASWLLASGATLKQVCDYLGHSSVSVTERHYAHLVPGKQAEQADKSPLAQLIANRISPK